MRERLSRIKKAKPEELLRRIGMYEKTARF